jgi:hypothetical protein
MRPVKHLNDLFNLANRDKRYEKLLIISAQNLGGRINSPQDAASFLEMQANAMGEEEGVVDEVNFCIDLVE